MAEARSYLDRRGFLYMTLDAGDDDFPGQLDAKDRWIMEPRPKTSPLAPEERWEEE